MKSLLRLAIVIAGFLSAPVAHTEALSLAYFMGPNHPMNRAVFTPFAENLGEISGGALEVVQYPGGALNSKPPKQYSILLDSVADISFILPGYTADLFPQTNLVSLPGVCESAIACTQALQNARSALEREYDAKVLALWANSPPVLLTRDVAVRSIEDLDGLIIRVTSKQDVPFVEALGATAVAQPVTVVNQNLANGVIDGVLIDPSGIRSFQLQEAANYVTTWFPGSGAAFALLMNRQVYDQMSDAEKAWVDAASEPALSLNGGAVFDRAASGGLALASESGLEVITLAPEEVARFNAAVAPVLQDMMARDVGGTTVGAALDRMKGQ